MGGRDGTDGSCGGEDKGEGERGRSAGAKSEAGHEVGEDVIENFPAERSSDDQVTSAADENIRESCVTQQ